MVTDIYKLDDFQDALDKMNSRTALKIAIKPWANELTSNRMSCIYVKMPCNQNVYLGNLQSRLFKFVDYKTYPMLKNSRQLESSWWGWIQLSRMTGAC